jgi:hypothetical protein
MNTLDTPQQLQTATPATGWLHSIGLRLAVVVGLIIGLAFVGAASASATSAPVGPVTVTPVPTTITGQAPDMVAGNSAVSIYFSYSYKTNSPGGCYGTPTYGALPPGLKFNAATCTLSGTPTTPGTYRFNLFAANWKAYVADTIVVVKGPGLVYAQ